MIRVGQRVRHRIGVGTVRALRDDLRPGALFVAFGKGQQAFVETAEVEALDSFEGPGLPSWMLCRMVPQERQRIVLSDGRLGRVARERRHWGRFVVRADDGQELELWDWEFRIAHVVSLVAGP